MFPADVRKLRKLGDIYGTGKINGINDLIHKYEVDCVAGCELQCDWRFAEENSQFRNLFGQGKQTRKQKTLAGIKWEAQQ